MLLGGKLSASDCHHTSQDLENIQYTTVAHQIPRNNGTQGTKKLSMPKESSQEASNPHDSPSRHRRQSEKPATTYKHQQKSVQDTTQQMMIPPTQQKQKTDNRNPRNCPGKTKTQKTPVEFSRITINHKNHKKSHKSPSK
jgi:hypothetical protein